MKYTEKEKKSLKFLTDKRDEAYGLMQFEDGEIYQLAEEEFNNYLTIEEIIEKQQKEIERLKEHLNQYYDGKLFTANQLRRIEKEHNKYFIHKDKIREKIKEIEDSLKEDCIALHEFQRLAKIDVLKELLGG